MVHRWRSLTMAQAALAEHSTRPFGKYTCSKGDNANSACRKSSIASDYRDYLETSCRGADCPFPIPYVRGFHDVAVGQAVNSDGCRFLELLGAKQFSSCGGPIRTEFTITVDTFPWRIDPLR